jgi:hypothetical protein
MKSGVEIYLDQLNTVQVANDGKTAKIGGGTLSKTVIDKLWAAGKQTGKFTQNPPRLRARRDMS